MKFVNKKKCTHQYQDNQETYSDEDVSLQVQEDVSWLYATLLEPTK